MRLSWNVSECGAWNKLGSHDLCTSIVGRLKLPSAWVNHLFSESYRYTSNSASGPNVNWFTPKTNGLHFKEAVFRKCKLLMLRSRIQIIIKSSRQHFIIFTRECMLVCGELHDNASLIMRPSQVMPILLTFTSVSLLKIHFDWPIWIRAKCPQNMFKNRLEACTLTNKAWTTQHPRDG